MGIYNTYDSNLIIKPKESYLDAQVKFTYICKNDNFNKLTLYLYDGLNIDTIKGESIEKYYVSEEKEDWNAFISEARRIEIYFDKKFNHGDKLNLTFEYSGEVTEIKNTGVNRISEEWTELGVYSPWFPLTESFEKAIFKTTIEVKGNPIVVGSNNTKYEKGKWIIDQKIPFVDCSFIASSKFKDNEYKNTIDDLEVSFYCVDDRHKEIAKYLSHKSFSLIKKYRNEFGPIEKQTYSVAILPRGGGGYNRPGLIVLPDLDDQTPSEHFKYLPGKIGNVMYLAHELAHLWWCKADVNTWEDWLNESFAEYSCLLAVKDIYGEEEFNKLINKYRNNIDHLPPIIGLDRSDENAFDTLYIKGPVLLNELENEIGTEKFREVLKEIHTNKINNTKGFLNKLTKITNTEVRDNFHNKLQK